MIANVLLYVPSKNLLKINIFKCLTLWKSIGISINNLKNMRSHPIAVVIFFRRGTVNFLKNHEKLVFHVLMRWEP
jgi:hypothetical protein